MSRFMRNGFMASMGAIIAVGIGISLGLDARGALSSLQKQLGLTPEPVLIVFVQDAKAVAGVRAAVADERVVAESAGAFALREGRIVATGNEAAEEMVSRAGWIERDLKLMRVKKKERPARAAEAGADDGGLPPDKLAELLSKDTLTYVEASMLLDHI